MDNYHHLSKLYQKDIEFLTFNIKNQAKYQGLLKQNLANIVTASDLFRIHLPSTKLQ